MRPTFWLSLVALCVGACLVRSSATHAEGRATPPAPAGKTAGRQVTFNNPTPDQKSRSTAQVTFKEDVQGKGQTPDEARTSAVERARFVIAAYLESEYGEANYTPAASYLCDAQILPPPQDIKPEQIPADEFGRTYKAEVKVEVTKEQVKEMRAQARQQRVTQRQHWLALGLAGFVSLLLVAVGYLRLEEATKGYYTGLLRLSALGVLALIGFFIWQMS
jgi:hypothetical protein